MKKNINIKNIVFRSSDLLTRVTPTLYLVMIITGSLLKNVCIETRGSPNMGISQI